MHQSLEVHSLAASGASRVLNVALFDSLGSRHTFEDVKRAIELELSEGSPFDLFRVNPNGSSGESLRAASWYAVDFSTTLLAIPAHSDFPPPTFPQETDSDTASVGISSIALETALPNSETSVHRECDFSRSAGRTGWYMHTPPSTRPSSVHGEEGPAELPAFSPLSIASTAGRVACAGENGAGPRAGTATPQTRASSCSRNTLPSTPLEAGDLEARLNRAQSHHHLSQLVCHDAYLPLASTFAESPRLAPSSARAATSPSFSTRSTARSAATTSPRMLGVTNALYDLSVRLPRRGSERTERDEQNKASDTRRTARAGRSPSTSRAASPARLRPSNLAEYSQQRPLSPVPQPTLLASSGSLTTIAPLPTRPVQHLRFAVLPSPAVPSSDAVTSRSHAHVPHTRVEPAHAPWVTVAVPKVQS